MFKIAVVASQYDYDYYLKRIVAMNGFKYIRVSEEQDVLSHEFNAYIVLASCQSQYGLIISVKQRLRPFKP